MKKILLMILGGLLAIYLLYFAFVYFVPYSEGTRAGELIKFSHKGIVVKTYEGEISQGISGAQIFKFSVMDQEKAPRTVCKIKLCRALQYFFLLG